MKKGLGRPLFFLVCMAVALAALVVAWPGRGGNAEQIAQDALRKSKELESYYFLLEMNLTPGLPAEKDYVEVWFSAPDRFRVQFFSGAPGSTLPEQVLLCDGEKHYIYSPEIGDFFHYEPGTAKATDSLLLLPDILQDIASAATLERVRKETEKESHVLKFVPSGRRSYAWGKVWLDRKTLMPQKLQYYCSNQNLQRELVFYRMMKNPPLEEETFRPDRPPGEA